MDAPYTSDRLGTNGLTLAMRIHMLICMRTTLVIDDELIRHARLYAAEHNITVSDVVNRALRDSLGRPAAPAAPFSLITYGRSGKRVRHQPSEFAAALDEEEQARLQRQC